MDFKIFTCLYLFLVVLDLHCRAQVFSTWGEQRCSVLGLLAVAASLVADHKLCSTWASVVVKHGLCCTEACGIFPDMG